jgi:hypothetical protein
MDSAPAPSVPEGRAVAPVERTAPSRMAPAHPVGKGG